MKIKHLAMEQFRNYEQLDLSLHPGINLFYGDNAQGKTNILEAVYLCGTTKSHRGAKEKEMIRFSEDAAHICMEIEKNEVDYRIDLALFTSRKRSVMINHVPVKKAAQVLSLGHFVFFSPEDLKIVKNGPGERRRFMDMEICQLRSVYIRDLASYNHILTQRSSLLREIDTRRDLIATLDIWDEQMISFGKKVIRARKDFIGALNEVIVPIHREMTGNEENIRIIYEKNVEEEEFEKKVAESRERDLKYKSSSYGPHRDDLMVMSNGVDLRKFGSQGQQRTAALSLKLAEIELVKKQTGENPVLLLDDVLSELDRKRQHFLLHNITEIQTLVTCTGLSEFEKEGIHVDRTFYVEKGHVQLTEVNGGLHG